MKIEEFKKLYEKIKFIHKGKEDTHKIVKKEVCKDCNKKTFDPFTTFYKQDELNIVYDFIKCDNCDRFICIIEKRNKKEQEAWLKLNPEHWPKL